MKIAALFALIVVGTFASAADPVLVGHWKLDEKEGDVAVDSSPSKNNGKIHGAPARVAGKVGGAMQFDGKSQYIEIPNTPELENVQEGNFTIAAWFKAENAPPGTEAANDAQYTLIAKTGWHLGLNYTNDKKFIFTYWVKGDGDPVWTGAGAWDQEYEPGEWHHLVGTVDQEARTVSIYLDGELKQTTDAWDAALKPRDYEKITWKIGISSPGAEQWSWPAKGAIGDVRIYNGALNAEKVKALFDGK